MPVLAPTRNGIDGDNPLPPLEEDESTGGGGRGWVELTKARGDIEAHLLTGRLAASGIESSTVTDRSAPGSFLYGGHNPWAPVAVLVRRIQLEDARLVLAELAYEGRPAEPQEARTSAWKGPVLWWVAAVSLAVMFTVLGVAQMMARCERDVRCNPVTRGDGSGVAGR